MLYDQAYQAYQARVFTKYEENTETVNTTDGYCSQVRFNH